MIQYEYNREALFKIKNCIDSLIFNKNIPNELTSSFIDLIDSFDIHHDVEFQLAILYNDLTLDVI